MRFKNRYLVLEMSFHNNKDRQIALSGLTGKQLCKVIKEAILDLHGDYGLACVAHSLNVKYINVVTDIAILRVPRDYYRNVWAAITMITSLQTMPCSLNVVHIGGTIKSCQKRIIKFNYDKLKQMLAEADSGVLKKKMIAKIKQVIEKDSIPLH